jgi:CubicO group peptidase (beta-lactamase class C family)
MNQRYKWVLVGVGLVALGGTAAGLYLGYQLVSIGAAYKGRILCSGVFVSQRNPQSILSADLSGDYLSVLRHINAHVDYRSREVTTEFLGFARRKAVYREGRGCAVVDGELPAISPARSSETPVSEARPRTNQWDSRDESPPEFDQARLQAALDWAFSDPDPELPRRTRAVAIVHQGRLVAERYAQGFTKETPQIGWSMTKSVINALVGILVKDGKISLNTPAPVPEWQSSGDPRHVITLEHLLRMTSGLRFNEDYSNPRADAPHMLFGVSDMAAYAAEKPLEAEPGTRWSYSSGSTNIIARVIRQVVAASDHYNNFPRRALFERIGMPSAVLETDATGTYVGSSFMYATARDWARFGLLYLNDGVWAGQRILPEGWVTYSRKITLLAPNQQYAAHFWLKVPDEYRRDQNARPLPADAFHAIGHEGQLLTIIPSRELVVVRLGLTRYRGAWDHNAFLNLVLDAILVPK